MACVPRKTTCTRKEVNELNEMFKKAEITGVANQDWILALRDKVITLIVDRSRFNENEEDYTNMVEKMAKESFVLLRMCAKEIFGHPVSNGDVSQGAIDDIIWIIDHTEINRETVLLALAKAAAAKTAAVETTEIAAAAKTTAAKTTAAAKTTIATETTTVERIEFSMCEDQLLVELPNGFGETVDIDSSAIPYYSYAIMRQCAWTSDGQKKDYVLDLAWDQDGQLEGGYAYPIGIPSGDIGRPIVRFRGKKFLLKCNSQTKLEYLAEIYERN